MSQKFGRLALHMWTIDTTPLATALDAAKQAGYDAVELRRTDFKRCFDTGMLAELADQANTADQACRRVMLAMLWPARPTARPSSRAAPAVWHCARKIALG